MAPSVAEIPSTGTPDSLFNELGWQVENEQGYRILEQPCSTKDPVRILGIGGGATGICLAKYYEDSLKDSNISLQIYEKNHDIGGTWLENRYPGCACDIPSVNYQFTWERNPYWTQFYSESPEIWQYFKDVTTKYGLDKYIKLKHQVESAVWQEDDGEWEVKVRDLATDTVFIERANVLVNGGGVLNNWKWPDIEGLHSFKGILEHTANYTEGRSLEGKRVAVIGIGSSGIQCVSNVASKVKQLYTFGTVKTPTWVTAGFAQRFAGNLGGNFRYTEKQKKMFADDPELFLKYSKMIESELNQRFKFILKGTKEAAVAKDYATNDMKTKLNGNQRILDAIIPKDFSVGCRRPTPGNGFLEALNRDNVHVFTNGPMQKVVPEGFIDADGKLYEVDMIICATGFNTSWIPRYPVIGEKGVTLQDLWKDSASPSYLSIGVPSMPNYFTICGPYGPLGRFFTDMSTKYSQIAGHGSFLPIIETLVGNAVKVVQKMQKDRIKKLTPKEDVARQFNEHADLYLKRTAWTEGCSSWFKQGRIDGPLPMFPGSRLTYLDLLAEPRFEDYNITYKNKHNMFEFLGNGFHAREFDGRDLSYYLGILDGVGDVQLDLEAELAADMDRLMPQLEEAADIPSEPVAGLS